MVLRCEVRGFSIAKIRSSSFSVPLSLVCELQKELSIPPPPVGQDGWRELDLGISFPHMEGSGEL